MIETKSLFDCFERDMAEEPSSQIERSEKFFKETAILQNKYNISHTHAACYVCNYDDDLLCHKFNNGCTCIETCRKIYDKENKMRELDTIQKMGKLNTVYAADEPGVGGANHVYFIEGNIVERPIRVTYGEHIQFQNGPRKDPQSAHGVLDTDLLEIVRDRLKSFQSGEFATDDNARALEHIEIALMYMNKRVEDRMARDVLGTYEK